MSSFREWLLEPFLQRLESLVAKTVADLNLSLTDLGAAIDKNTQVTQVASAAIAGLASGGADLTPQVNAVQTATQKVNAASAALLAVIPPPPTPAPQPAPAPTPGSLTASPATITLSAANPTVSLAIGGGTAPYSLSASEAGIVSITPGSGTGPFAVQRLAAGTITVTATDASGVKVVIPANVS